MSRSTLAWFLALLLVAGLATLAGDIALTRVETQLALQCARDGAGTDSAIVDCFTRYGLDAPGDL